jgi:predicted enzyme related to lactoylglutathione lyase
VAERVSLITRSSNVGVADVEAALRRAEELGGTRIMGPATSPNGLVVAHFSDPEGTVIGLAGTA